jgi:hypothetical protein
VVDPYFTNSLTLMFRKSVLAKNLGNQNRLPPHPHLLLPLKRFTILMHILYRNV